MKQLLSPKAILLLTLAFVIVPVTAIEYLVLQRTGGVFMYPLDDVFIHMAVAKNLASHGNWGMNPVEFASASSSLLYTLLLTGFFKIFGAKVIIPFLVNCIAGVALVAAVQRWLQKEQINGRAQLLILCVVVLLTPIPILLICGMEHTLQCLFTFGFVFGFARWLEESLASKQAKWNLPSSLLVYAILVTFIRYEGLFLVAIACLILAWHRKMTLAVKLGLASLLPLVIFGIYSISKGSYFLPNSVLLKSEAPGHGLAGVVRFFNNILIEKLTVVKTDNIPAGTPRPGISLLATQRLLILLPLAYLAFYTFIRQRLAYAYILIILLGCTILQLCFASTGWLYRYEAYLIFCSTLIISVLIAKNGRELICERPVAIRWMLAVALFAICFPFLLRSTAAYSKTGTACVNIYEQQYQMGQFLHTYYDRDVTAVNDIGAVSFFTSGENIDLWGLGNIKVARSRKARNWTPDFLDSLCRKDQATNAIIYDKWFNDTLLSKWTRVATWQIPNNVICGDDTVSFYSIDKSHVADLKLHLQEYSKRLPAEVIVKFN